MAKLLRRFVRLAVLSSDELTFSDQELLDDILRYGSLSRVARLRHVSTSALCQRLKAVIDHLDEGIARWESIANSDQAARIAQLEQRLAEAESRVRELEEKAAKMGEYNRILTVAKAQESQLNDQYRKRIAPYG